MALETRGSMLYVRRQATCQQSMLCLFTSMCTGTKENDIKTKAAHPSASESWFNLAHAKRTSPMARARIHDRGSGWEWKNTA